MTQNELASNDNEAMASMVDPGISREMPLGSAITQTTDEGINLLPSRAEQELPGPTKSVNDSTSQTVPQTQQEQLTAAVPVPACPVLAANVQLIGELQESGFKDRQWLIQRDGRFIQVTELLYRVAEQINGERPLDDIAAGVTEATDWIVSSDNVQRIIQTKLIPMGLVATATVNGSIVPHSEAAGTDRVRSPLAVNMRMKIVSPRIIDPIARVLQILYAPPVLIPALITIAIAHGWLYLVHGVTHSIRDVLYTPGLLLIVLAFLLIGGIFHEFGHASALRYGGGKVRGMGAGIYLFYPAFYTDVTDSYRLGRWARVRTDLGGFYFSLLFTLAIMAFSFVCRLEFLLSIVVLIDLDIIFQNMPFVRFDGYWALADLTGIPDFFSQIGPFLRAVLPLPAWRGSKLPNVKPWVRMVFASYVIITVVVLAFLLVLTVVYTPTMVLTTWDALLAQNEAFTNALSKGDVLVMVVSVVQELLLSLPLWATAYLFYILGQGPLKTLWSWSKLTPKRRITVAMVAVMSITLVAFLWTPQLPFEAGSVKAVDGIPCNQSMYAAEHIHAHLVIYVKGQAVLVPLGIGMPAGGNCFYWLHTHQTDGVIHVEAPARGVYTLGQFTDIWAQTMHTSVLTSTSFLGYPLKDHQFVIWTSNNGQPAQRYEGNLLDLVLRNHQIITIAYDSPQVQPITHFDWLDSSAAG